MTERREVKTVADLRVFIDGLPDDMEVWATFEGQFPVGTPELGLYRWHHRDDKAGQIALLIDAG